MPGGTWRWNHCLGVIWNLGNRIGEPLRVGSEEDWAHILVTCEVADAPFFA